MDAIVTALPQIFAATAGPASAVVVLLIVLYGLYMVLTKHFMPLIKGYIDDQRDMMKDILAEHTKDRETFQSAVYVLVERQERLEGIVNEVRSDVEKILERRTR